MNKGKAYRVALGGVLFALALALSFIESIIAPMLGLMPGIKLGLSNVVVMYALFFMGSGQAYMLCGLKAFFVLLTRGVVAGFLSLTGGLVSLSVMLLLHKLPFSASYYMISVTGAICHNLGQLAGASLLLGSGLTMAYLPILLVSGLAVGAITAQSLSAVLPALAKLNIKADFTCENAGERPQGKT